MSAMHSPLISIITPYRNAQRFLPGLAASLQAQTYPHWECLLINHASIDGGPALASELAKRDPRFRSLQEHNLRPLPAIPRNRAMGLARGELICFLDVDDLWHPAKLERQLAFHQEGGLELSVTAYGRFRAGSGEATGTLDMLPKRWRPRCPPARISHRRLLWDNPIPMLTVMVNRELMTIPAFKEGPFAPIHHEDYLLWLSLWKLRPQLRYGCLKEVLAFHRRHDTNITGQRWRMLGWTYWVYRSEGQGLGAAALRSTRHALLRLVNAVCSG
jgi:teichuronic acid biosynthesis glycosyltransferase TuaG